MVNELTKESGVEKKDADAFFHVISWGKKKKKNDENQVKALARNNSEKCRRKQADLIHSTLYIPDKKKTIISFIPETKKQNNSLTKKRTRVQVCYLLQNGNETPVVLP